MQQDRFGKAFGTVVRRVIDDAATIDYSALYTARVVQWQSSGVNPSGLVDVIFDVPALKSKTGIPVLPPWPGVSYQPKPGSLVVVGWLQCDESKPYAAAWLGVGGVTMAELAGDRVDVTAAAVNLGDATGRLLMTQGIVAPLMTVMTAIGTFATAVGAALPAVATAATTLNTAIGIFTGQLNSDLTTKTKAS